MKTELKCQTLGMILLNNNLTIILQIHFAGDKKERKKE